MSQSIGQSIGNYIGDFLEYDEKNNTSSFPPFIRLRVLLDVRKSLKISKKNKKIKKPKRVSTEVFFQVQEAWSFSLLLWFDRAC